MRFEKLFNELSIHQNRYKTWSDLMYMFAVAISNATTKNIIGFEKVWRTRENEYINIMKRYNKREQDIIIEIFSEVVHELGKNPHQDLLGDMYMKLEISNKNTGQFFTPYNLCECLSGCAIEREKTLQEIKERGYISLYDCAVGGGATLISAINTISLFFENWQDHVCVFAQDIDITCANMCYIQLSMMGVPLVVKVGNTLTEPEFRATEETLGEYWFSPMWFSETWSLRRLFHNFDICMNKKEYRNETM